MNKLSLFSQLNKPNKQTGLKIQHSFILFHYVADPATYLASNSGPGPYFPLRTACLVSTGKDEYFFVFVLSPY